MKIWYLSEEDTSITCPYCRAEIEGIDYNEYKDVDKEYCSACGEEIKIIK